MINGDLTTLLDQADRLATSDLSAALGFPVRLAFDHEQSMWAVWGIDDDEIIGAGATSCDAVSDALRTAHAWFA